MTYTMRSAAFANAAHSAAVVETDEAGSVALSAADTPDDWLDLLCSGIAIAPFEPPQAPAFAVTPTPEQWRALLKATGKTYVEIDALFALAATI